VIFNRRQFILPSRRSSRTNICTRLFIFVVSLLMQALYYFRDYNPPASSNQMDTSTIWLLGKKHECEITTDDKTNSIQAMKYLFPSFTRDFESRIWCTYRKDFPTIETSYYTSDMGWGCMHRTAQMTLAQAFLVHYLGRDWQKPENDCDLPDKYFEILQLFADHCEAPYSIHNISMVGSNQNKAVGEWYGPSTVAQSVKELVEKYQGDKFAVYISDNGIIYENEVEQMCVGESGEWEKSLILFIPLRLGVDVVPTLYYRIITSLFQYPQSLGMAGGKPRSSLYFIGVQGDSLFYLDPHVVFSAVDSSTIPFDASTYQPRDILNIKIADIDPSFSATFYCRNKEDFNQFCQQTRQLHEEMDGDHLFSIEKIRKKEEEGEIDIDWPEDGDFSLLMDDDPELKDFVIL